MVKKIIMATFGLLLASSLSAANIYNSAADIRITDIQKKILKNNKRYTLSKISIEKKKELGNSWNMYVFNMDVINNDSKKAFSTPMIVFTNGIYQTNSLLNLKTFERYEITELKSIQQSIKINEQKAKNSWEQRFKLPKKYYDKEHLIAGDINAKNKVLILSDPLCVACIGRAPNLIKSIKKRKDTALFYYHFPLINLHPTSLTIARAMNLAREDGVKDVELKIYKANFMKFYDVYKSKDNKKALEIFNKVMGTNYTMKDVERDKNIKQVERDMKLGGIVKLSGTPTIIFNGSLYQAQKKLSQLFMQR